MQLNRKAVRFSLIAFPVGVVTSIYLALSNLNAMQQMGVETPAFVLVLSSLIQIAGLYTLALGYLGYVLSERVGLAPVRTFGKRKAVIALAAGFCCALVMLSDLALFAPVILQIKAAYTRDAFSLPALLFAMLYGGVIEEIMLRLFFLSLLVFLMDRIFDAKRGERPIRPLFFQIANVLAALLFALGHLPATQVAFGTLTTLLVVRSLVLNGVLGWVFGLLYLKLGLQYAMMAHALTHLFNQAILLLFIL